MATKKVSGRDLATDVRSGMDCAALAEKHGLSVAQLKKALGALVAKSILSGDELPSWVAEEKPWKCPKCGRSQPERFPRCPVCGVIIAKLRTTASDSALSQLPGSLSASSPESSKWKVITAAIGAISLVAFIIVFTRTNSPSPQPIQPLAHQADTSQDRTAVAEADSPNQDTVSGGADKAISEDAVLRNPKVQRIARLAQQYYRTHTYSRDDQFACVDMSVDVWNQIQTAGIRAGLMAGNVETDITGLRGANAVQYVAEMNHAWVVAEIELGRWLPVECTAGVIVSPLDPKYSRYFSGEFFTNPRDFKWFEELRRNFFKDCLEAQQMQESFREMVKGRPQNREAVLEAYRARGKLDQRAHDCNDHLKRIQQVLEGRAEMIVPWITQ